MKKKLVIAMAALLCFTFNGCGNRNSKVYDVLDKNIENEEVQNNNYSEKEENRKEGYQQAEEGAQAPEDNYYEIDIAGMEDLNSENLSKEEFEAFPKPASDADKEEGSVDIDLTQMSSIMIYSEVYNIMINPEDYLGKTIKICGPYYASYWEDTDKYYHYVIINDATACCSSGLEFIWEDNSHKYPEEYPKDETEIELVGRFDSYEELGQTYYYLATDSFYY